MLERLETFYALSTALAATSDADLTRLISQAPAVQGWGSNHIITLNDKRIFVKKIPLTAREFENPFSMENVYDLPAFYNYGFGSAGLGAYRELFAHIATTNAVLCGDMQKVPLLYHYRVVKTANPREKFDEVEHAEDIEYWAASPQIDTYLRARYDAPREIVLCLEELPHCLGYDEWFSTNTHRINDIAEAIFETIKDFRAQDILHFDCQFNNILTDGDKFYLADFGLVIPKRACVSESDTHFYQNHLYHPEAVFLASCSWHLRVAFNNATKETRNQIIEIAKISDPENEFKTRLEILKVLESVADDLLALRPEYAAFLLKYREPIQIANWFTYGMINNNAKDTPIVTEQFEQALRRTGWT